LRCRHVHSIRHCHRSCARRRGCRRCAGGKDDDRAQALAGLDAAAVELRAAAVIWFAQNGVAADDKLVLPRLGDEDPMVRELAERGMWMLWSRSGDDAIDALMTKGQGELGARDFAAAIATYSEVIRRKPAFAEGWNKRATAYFLNDELKRSLADCDQVMKRNPYHFGALSGYGQIYFQQKQYDKGDRVLGAGAQGQSQPRSGIQHRGGAQDAWTKPQVVDLTHLRPRAARRTMPMS
jgi:tetratricopeptide (TPR) repeat protein